jgi:FSR family fosmidomycin resistance protein-like MFS transporter
VVEPFLGILGDVWKRRVLVLGGGVFFAISLLLTAVSSNYIVLLASFVLFYPSSGAFVSLAQASLMDMDTARHEQNMARWTFAGSLGVTAGVLALGGASLLNLGWRPLFFVFAAISFALVAFAWRMPFVSHQDQDDGEERTGFRRGALNALRALKRGEVLRWLTLLQFSDLMLDVLLGFLALYFVDVVRVTEEQAALAVLTWTVTGLVGDFLIIPLLERVRGLSYLRLSAAVVFILYVAFLLSPLVWTTYVLLALLGLFNAGWYSILQGRLYSAMPRQSGTVMTVSNLFGLVGGLLPAILGQIADEAGLQVAMWLLLLGPVALLVGLPRQTASRHP